MYTTRKLLLKTTISAAFLTLAACDFEPAVTPIVWPTPGEPSFGQPLDLQPQPSLAPLAATPTPPVSSPDEELPLSGGDATVGYDFLEGTEPPTWRIWYEGKELLVTPNDPGTAVLLSNFFSQAELRAQAIADYDDAAEAAKSSKAAGWLSSMGAGAGGAVALLSCGGVPFTFWAAGGTGWTCALGIAGALAGGGSAILSFIDTSQERSDQQGALDRWESTSEEANSLFEALEGSTAP